MRPFPPPDRTGIFRPELPNKSSLVVHQRMGGERDTYDPDNNVECDLLPVFAFSHGGPYFIDPNANRNFGVGDERCQHRLHRGNKVRPGRKAPERISVGALALLKSDLLVLFRARQSTTRGYLGRSQARCRRW